MNEKKVAIYNLKINIHSFCTTLNTLKMMPLLQNYILPSKIALDYCLIEDCISK
jgi:hypothetical protein